MKKELKIILRKLRENNEAVEEARTNVFEAQEAVFEAQDDYNREEQSFKMKYIDAPKALGNNPENRELRVKEALKQHLRRLEEAKGKLRAQDLIFKNAWGRLILIQGEARLWLIDSKYHDKDNDDD